MKKEKRKEVRVYLNSILAIINIVFITMCFNIGFLVILYLLDYPKTIFTIMFSMGISSLVTMMVIEFLNKNQKK